MNELNIASVISQIRTLRQQTASMRPVAAPVAPAALQAGQAIGMPAFGDVLQNTLTRVNEAQASAAKLQEGFQLGDPRADLPSVMLAMQKSQVSFRALVEVRNRVVQAYQDVMNMPM